MPLTTRSISSSLSILSDIPLKNPDTANNSIKSFVLILLGRQARFLLRSRVRNADRCVAQQSALTVTLGLRSSGRSEPRASGCPSRADCNLRRCIQGPKASGERSPTTRTTSKTLAPCAGEASAGPPGWNRV